jgi:prepilin-type N-terminal cleavage/methylation domain-containing protein
MKNQKGFSLVELLVVVIIIAIVAAIAIPNLLASRRAANEASAINSLRTIHSAQATYFGTTGLNATYSALGNLDNEGLIDATLAGGTKSGYGFTVALSTDAPASSQYCGLATPTSTGITGTGNRWFGVSSPGVIYGHTAAGVIACDAATGLISGGTAIQ